MSNPPENIIKTVNCEKCCSCPDTLKTNIPNINQPSNPKTDRLKQQMSEYMLKAGQMYDETREKAKPMIEFMIKYWYIILIVIFFFICLFFYFKYFFRRAESGIKTIKSYRDKMSIGPIVENKELMNGKYKLCDFYIASSAKSYLPCTQYYDYASIDVIQYIIEAGARYIELDVFPSSFCWNCDPVVMNGNIDGLWPWTTRLCFEECIERIHQTAFSSTTINNTSDPFFLYLNISCFDNEKLLKKIADVLDKYLKYRMLSNSYKTKDIAKVPIKEFINKCIIISNRSWEGSSMSEYVNFSMDIKINSQTHEQVIETHDPTLLRETNKQALTRVYPAFSGRETRNYTPISPWLNGCQFVCMNYQLNDINMDIYIEKFKTCSLILKPEPLRYKEELIPDPIVQNKAVDMKPLTYESPYGNFTY
jgi:hypothetical protein